MTKDTYDYYVDDFGNLKKKKNLKNWTDYSPWQYWGHRYNWIKCDNEFEQFDRLCWRDDVYYDSQYGQTLHEGSRFVIGEIRKIKDSKQGMLAAIVVLHAEGLEPYPHNAEIYRQIWQIIKNGVYRAPRYEEGQWFKNLPGSDLASARSSKMDQGVLEASEKDSAGDPLPKPVSRYFSGLAKPKTMDSAPQLLKPPKL